MMIAIYENMRQPITPEVNLHNYPVILDWRPPRVHNSIAPFNQANVVPFELANAEMVIDMRRRHSNTANQLMFILALVDVTKIDQPKLTSKLLDNFLGCQLATC